MQKNLARSGKILAAILGCVLLVIIVGAIYNLLKPTVLLTFAQPYNPLGNVVKINNKDAYPTGKNGATYREKVRPGTATVEVSGPFISSVSTTVKAGLLQTKELPLAPTKLSGEQVVALNKNIDVSGVSNVTVFKNQWITARVVSATKTEEGDDYTAVVLRYDTSTRSWKDVTDQLINNSKTLVYPAEVRRYLYELSTD